MGGIRLFFTFLAVCLAGLAQADDRTVRLAAPAPLVDSGLLDYILPRFSLKTQVRVQLVAPGDTAEVALGDEGRPVFAGPARTWHMAVLAPDHPGAAKFADWLTSDVALATIAGFAPDGTALFHPPEAQEAAPEVVVVDDDAARAGLAASVRFCSRCHVVSDRTRMTAIGSTPSFYLMRAFEDWEYRFQVFYLLNPHPAFTQVDGVTEPFPIHRPSPIVPIEMTVEDVDAIVAYVAGLKPADLGAPLQHQ